MASFDKLKPGTLVQIARWALDNDTFDYASDNRATVREHGYLWLVVGHTDPANCPLCIHSSRGRTHTVDHVGVVGHMLDCKSLATGIESNFFARELEIASATPV